MTHKKTIRAAALVVALLPVVGTGMVQAQKTRGTTGTATLANGLEMRITQDGDLNPYVGTFDRDGNFSFNLVGTERRVCFTFADADALGLLTPPRVAGVTPPATACYPTSFQILLSSDGLTIGTMSPGGPPLIRSVRFNLVNNPATPTDPTSYALGFRGDAELDGVPEMSKVKVTCTENGSTGACARWELEPCPAVDAYCTAEDVGVQSSTDLTGAAVGQVTAGLPKGKGNTTVDRYVMPWRMTIVKP
jgi:hypothetical protein